jgi:hypothetical protein
LVESGWSEHRTIDGKVLRRGGQLNFDFLMAIAENFGWQHVSVAIYDETGSERFRSPLTITIGNGGWDFAATTPIPTSFRACYHSFFDRGGSPILTSPRNDYHLSAGDVPRWRITLD